MENTQETSKETMELVGQFFRQRMQQEKAEKLERFRHLNPMVKKGQILFCGSSLMEQFPIQELLLDLDCPLTVYNRGVGGFTTREMAQALEECVFQLEPRHVFINIGTNDLNGPDYSLEGLMERYEAILWEIRVRLPEAGLYLLAYYPVNEEVGLQNELMGQVFRYRTNARIREANRAVERLAGKLGARYLDLNAGITDGQGNLKREYTIEGMHMYGDGYRQVLELLLPLLRELA